MTRAEYYNRDVPFEKHEERLAKVCERVKDHMPSCPNVIFGVVPQKTIEIMAASKTIVEKGGLLFHVDMRELDKEHALRMIKHYETAIQNIKTYIEETMK